MEANSSWLPVLANLGGAVVITSMFLFYLLRRGDRADSLAAQALSEVKTLAEEFREHNKTIVAGFTSTTREQHDQMKSIMGDHLEVTRETVKAVTELKGAVEALRIQVARREAP